MSSSRNLRVPLDLMQDFEASLSAISEKSRKASRGATKTRSPREEGLTERYI